MNESTSEATFSAGRRLHKGTVSLSSASPHENSRFVLATCRRDIHSDTDTVSRDPDAYARAARPSSNECDDDADDTTGNEESLLAVYCRAGKLGAASYSLQTGELLLLEEIAECAPEFLVWSAVVRRVQPARVLLDPSAHAGFARHVGATLRHGHHATLQQLPSKEYSFEACKRRIYTLSLANEPTNCTEEQRRLFLRTVINFNQTQTVHALGALLRYLDLNWTKLNMEIQSKPQFLSLRTISLEDTVTIDDDTYKGLQIFSTVSHPSNFKKGVQGSNREGMSLYHMFSKCSSKIGQSQMRVFLQHPTKDLPTLVRRQDVIAFFMKPENEPIMRNICSSLRFIKNVNGILAKIKALSTKPYQWKSLYNTIYNAVLICEMCENVKGCQFLTELGSCDVSQLYEITSYMNRIIDFDISKSEGKFTVKAGVDQELDTKKQTMASLYGLMSETAKVELDKLPSYIDECTMVYMPHLGYLLGVKEWAEHLTMEQKILPDLKFMFQNNDYIHYKSKGCEELDVVVGDAYPQIVAHETRILMRLSGEVLRSLTALHSLLDQCATLDCLITIAKVCKEHNYVRPTLTTEKVISIKEGRHPLHSINCETFVPNDFESSEQAGLVKIITGPNSSGKSVYMKQIALIVYLAHVGSFVPAAAAHVGLITHLFSRLQSSECVAAGMSAFLIDLRQMSVALRGCGATERALVVADEFGAGTGEAAGVALLAAAVNSLLAAPARCPHLLIATHHARLPQLLLPTPLCSYLSLEHMVREDGAVVFLYRVVDRLARFSLAREVAAACGLPAHVTDRAATVLAALQNNRLPAAAPGVQWRLRPEIEIMKNELLAEHI